MSYKKLLQLGMSVSLVAMSSGAIAAQKIDLSQLDKSHIGEVLNFPANEGIRLIITCVVQEHTPISSPQLYIETNRPIFDSTHLDIWWHQICIYHQYAIEYLNQLSNHDTAR